MANLHSRRLAPVFRTAAIGLASGPIDAREVDSRLLLDHAQHQRHRAIWRCRRDLAAEAQGRAVECPAAVAAGRLAFDRVALAQS